MFSTSPRTTSVITRGAAAVWMLMIAGLFCATAWGQLYTGSVTGLVTDPSGAVVPNAQVKLVDEAKGFSFNAVSDSSGRYHSWPN